MPTVRWAVNAKRAALGRLGYLPEDSPFVAALDGYSESADAAAAVVLVFVAALAADKLGPFGAPLVVAGLAAVVLVFAVAVHRFQN